MQFEMSKFPDSVGERLDKFLDEKFEDKSRSQIQKLIKSGTVFVNREKVKAGYLLSENDVVFVKEAELDDEIKAENLNLEILFEDDDFFVINKPPGMVVHPSDGQHMSGTVVNALRDRIDIDDPERPGIVHRLDKETSGVMVVARNLKARDYFIDLFKSRKVKKHYKVLVSGHLKFKEGVIDSPIARDTRNRKKMAIRSTGKVAVSNFTVLDEFSVGDFDVSLLDVEIKTGRTHQIRVHMSSIGHPVVGDNVYGARKINRFFADEFGLARQFLHASTLSFTPPGAKKALTVKSELSDDLSKVLSSL